MQFFSLLELHRETAGFSRMIVSYAQCIMNALEGIFWSQDHFEGTVATLIPRSNMPRLIHRVSAE
jgi:hypothetical protein